MRRIEFTEDDSALARVLALLLEHQRRTRDGQHAAAVAAAHQAERLMPQATTESLIALSEQLGSDRAAAIATGLPVRTVSHRIRRHRTRTDEEDQ